MKEQIKSYLLKELRGQNYEEVVEFIHDSIEPLLRFKYDNLLYSINSEDKVKSILEEYFDNNLKKFIESISNNEYGKYDSEDKYIHIDKHNNISTTSTRGLAYIYMKNIDEVVGLLDNEDFYEDLIDMMR